MTMLAVNIPLFPCGHQGRSACASACKTRHRHRGDLRLRRPARALLARSDARAALARDLRRRSDGRRHRHHLPLRRLDGGTDMAARLLHHFTRLGVGRSLFIFDGIGHRPRGDRPSTPNSRLYAFLSVFLTSKTIDLIQEGRPYAKGGVHHLRKGERDREADPVRARPGRDGAPRPRALHREDRDSALGDRRPPRDPAAAQARPRRSTPRRSWSIADVSDVLGEGFRAIPSAARSAVANAVGTGPWLSIAAPSGCDIIEHTHA